MHQSARFVLSQYSVPYYALDRRRSCAEGEEAARAGIRGVELQLLRQRRARHARGGGPLREVRGGAGGPQRRVVQVLAAPAEATARRSAGRSGGRRRSLTAAAASAPVLRRLRGRPTAWSRRLCRARRQRAPALPGRRVWCSASTPTCTRCPRRSSSTTMT